MYRFIPLDGAAELFDPRSGHRLRVTSDGTAGVRQVAPRSVQFALTNHCNLACSFCSRPTERPSTWTVASALEVLADLDRLGVAEVAFGGGEPLVFKGFFELVDRLARETRLAVHLTTNGRLLTDDALDRLAGRIGEIRLSLYDDNDWQGTVARLVRRGVRFGVNVLVAPENVDGIWAILDDLRERGVRDVLLLPMVGHAQLMLSADQGRRLAALLEAPHRLTVKLGVCWGSELAHLPRLFGATDCGAGVEFLEVTSDRHVRPCSFHAVAVPFTTAEDALAIWASRREQLTVEAGCVGCPRPCATRGGGTVEGITVREYTAFASNNSGSYTLLGRFESVERAEHVAALLNQVARDMEAAGVDTNPLRDLLAASGVPAPAEVGRWDDWPDTSYASSPEAVALNRQVWWFAAYTIGMPKEVGAWFYALGGRVEVELDHAHHPVLARVGFHADLPWKARIAKPLDPLIQALWLGPLEGSDVVARVREGEHHTVEVLWLGPSPVALQELVRVAAAHGFVARVNLVEAPSETPNLDALW